MKRQHFPRLRPHPVVAVPDSFGAATSLRRAGWSAWAIVLTGVSLSVPVAAWSILPSFMSGETPLTFLTAEVTVGPFLNRVLEQGEIESSSSVDVRCEVRSRNSSGTNILKIIPEGSRVQAGDVLVTLDNSALETELTQQQIVCSGSESLFIEAEASCEAAMLGLAEYEKGTFREQRETLESFLVVAEENKRRAEEYLSFSRKLFERGFVSLVQLEADKFALKKADKDVDVAQTKLDVLDEFTKKKMLNSLEAAIKTANARFDARKNTLKLDRERLTEIETQIAKCVIKAPAAGQVVYANDARRGSSGGELLVAEGLPVRERQIIVRLPDPSKMRALAKVHESRISLVKKGVTAEIVTDALADRTLTGTVTSVSEYPLPAASIYTAHVKEYAVEIEIHSPPPELRPGMSSQVNLMVEHQDSAIQVPLGAIIARADRFFCAIPQEDNSFETREVKVGSSNESSIVVLENLKVGEKVVLSPNEDVLKKLDLPEVAPVTGAASEDASAAEKTVTEALKTAPAAKSKEKVATGGSKRKS